MASYASQFSGPGLSYVSYGNTRILFYNGKIILTIGPDCKFYIGLALLGFNILIFAIHLVLVLEVLSSFDILKYFTSISFTYLQVAFIYCGLKDPGVMFPSMEIDMNCQNTCPRCGAEKIGYHCSRCDICIQGHDHHCGFIGKCVGQGNLKAFYALLCGVFVCSGIFVVSMAWKTWNLKK